MKPRLPLGFLAALATTSALPFSSYAQVTTGWNQTGAGPFDYNDTNNWVNGTINGVWDASLTLTAAQTIQFSADAILTTSLDFQAFGSQNILLQGTGGARTITLGGDITSNISVNKALTIGSATTANNLNVDLGGVTRTFTAGSSKSLTFKNVISNGAVSTYGGTVIYEGINTYSGTTTVNTGILALNGGVGSAANSDFTVNANSSSTNLQFNSTTNGNTGTTRAKSVTLNGSGGSNGANVSASGNATANSNDVITNALTVVEGYAIVSVSANAAKNAVLSAGSFSREAGSSVLFRGSNLGVSTLASLTAGAANINFTSAPTLVGSGTANQTTIGIIAGAYGDITSSGDGKNGGLVTYDSTYGVRLLNTSTEYTAGITSGQTQVDNVLYQRASGGASQDTNLTHTLTTINSLSFKITGAGTNSGVTISGDASTTLKINSGAIFVSQQVTTANATDAITLSAPTINLNGKEGVIQVFTTGVSNSNTVAPLYISSAISNDGGNGVTFGGTGQTQLTGSSDNTYTGVTTLNSGILRLNKTGAATANTLPTDLIMNGGILIKNNNSIADTASVTINGGSFVMDTTTSSGNNGSSETINNLTMTGGRVQGSGGSSSVLTINGNMSLSGGLVQLNNGGDVIVSGNTTLNGGVLNARLSSSTTAFNGLTTLNTLSITNVASGAYTPIVLTGHATNKGALLTINGDVTFTGNGTNTNTVRIDTSDIALANQGVIALEGTRTFNVGNGAAAEDLTIVPTLQDGVSTGGLTKIGLGTLALGGANTYTGATTVTNGTLSVFGSIASSAATVGNGATLALSGTGTAGAVTVNLGGNFQLGTAGTAGAVTVNSGTFGGVGTVNSLAFTGTSAFGPGNSPGTVTIADGGSLALNSGTTSTFQFTDSGFGVGTFDLVTTSGTATGTIDGILNLDFTGTGYTAGTSVTFINLSSLTGTFSSINVTGLSGLTATVNYNNAAGDVSLSLATTAVPEPSTFALLGGAASLLLATFRRRRTAV